MTLPAARDLARSGIRVCTIAPGLFDTPLLGAPARGDARGARRRGPLPPAPRAARGVRRSSPCHIVENEMLNGEVIRLDGALRMAPR